MVIYKMSVSDLFFECQLRSIYIMGPVVIYKMPVSDLFLECQLKSIFKMCSDVRLVLVIIDQVPS